MGIGSQGEVISNNNQVRAAVCETVQKLLKVVFLGIGYICCALMCV